MTTLVVLTVVEIVVLIAGLAFFLFWIGSLLTRIATNLEKCSEHVQDRERARGRHRAGRRAHQPHRQGGRVGAAAAVRLRRADRGERDAGPAAAARWPSPRPARRRSRLHETVGFKSE